MSRLDRRIHVPLADEWARIIADEFDSSGGSNASQTRTCF